MTCEGSSDFKYGNKELTIKLGLSNRMAIMITIRTQGHKGKLSFETKLEVRFFS